MANGFFLGEEPIGPIQLGVPPLRQLQGIQPTEPATRRPDEEDDGAGRERLARILLALGGIGNKRFQPPAFLTQELAQRGETRREEARERRKGARQQAAGTLLSQGFQAELEGDDEQASQIYQRVLQSAEDPQMAKEALANLKAISARGRGVSAEARAKELQFKAGARALAADTLTELVGRFKEMGLDASTINLLAKQYAPEVRTEGDFTVVRDGRGNILKTIPTDRIVKSGETLLRASGVDITGIAARQPKFMTRSVGEGRQEILEVPEVVIPERGASQLTPGAIQPTGGITGGPSTPTVAVPAPPARTKVPVDDQLLLRSVGIDKQFVEDFTQEEAQAFQKLRSGGTGVKITAEQAPFFSTPEFRKAGVHPGMTWEQVLEKFPNAGQVFLREKSRETTEKAVATAVAQRKERANEPFIAAFPTSAKTTFNRVTGQRDETLSLNDVISKRGVLLDVESARAMTDIAATLPGLIRLRNVATKILAERPGQNLKQAFTLAIQKGLASNEDLAEFESLAGVKGRQVARAIERARTSDQDAEAILKSFPTTFDTGATATRRLNTLIKLLVDSREAYLGKQMDPLTAEDLKGAVEQPTLGSPKPGGGRFKRPPLPPRQ